MEACQRPLRNLTGADEPIPEVDQHHAIPLSDIATCHHAIAYTDETKHAVTGGFTTMATGFTFPLSLAPPSTAKKTLQGPKFTCRSPPSKGLTTTPAFRRSEVRGDRSRHSLEVKIAEW